MATTTTTTTTGTKVIEKEKFTETRRIVSGTTNRYLVRATIGRELMNVSWRNQKCESANHLNEARETRTRCNETSWGLCNFYKFPSSNPTLIGSTIFDRDPWNFKQHIEKPDILKRHCNRRAIERLSLFPPSLFLSLLQLYHANDAHTRSSRRNAAARCGQTREQFQPIADRVHFADNAFREPYPGSSFPRGNGAHRARERRRRTNGQGDSAAAIPPAHRLHRHSMRNYIQLLADKPSWEFSEPWSESLRDGYTRAPRRERRRPGRASERASEDRRGGATTAEGEGDGRR